MLKNYILFISFVFIANSSCAAISVDAEIDVNRAIKVAKSAASERGYDTKDVDVEVIKFKNYIERGPLRLAWLVRSYPRDITDKLLHKEFWIVYLYPKKQSERASYLGGDYTAFIDIYSGKVLDSFAGQ